MINKILVAIDGSISAKNAVEYAVRLAKEVNAQIEIIYVIKYAIGAIDAGILPIDIEAHEKENALKLIDEIKKEHPDISIKDFEPIGQPTEEIIKTIKNWEADLLVIGHHTHSFIDKILMGSVENTILHHIHIPVLVIPKI